jgi:uroporphyrinogen-III synthase
VAILQRLDFQATHVPTLSIQANHTPELLAMFGNLEEYTDLLFVSRNSVEVGMPMIEQQGGIPDGVSVMAVGGETAKQLYGYDIDAMYPSQGSGAEALLKVSQLKNLEGRKVLVVRGEHGLSWPSEEMRKRGAIVDDANCYQQAIPEKSSSQLLDALEQNDHLAGVFVHSAQSLRNLMLIAGYQIERVSQSVLVAGSQRIADTAKELNWKGEIRVAESPTNKHMMIAFSG